MSERHNSAEYTVALAPDIRRAIFDNEQPLSDHPLIGYANDDCNNNPFVKGNGNGN